MLAMQTEQMMFAREPSNQAAGQRVHVLLRANSRAIYRVRRVAMTELQTHPLIDKCNYRGNKHTHSTAEQHCNGPNMINTIANTTFYVSDTYSPRANLHYNTF